MAQNINQHKFNTGCAYRYQLFFSNLIVLLLLPSKYLKVGHRRPASKTPFKWRFACEPIVFGDANKLAGYVCTFLCMCVQMSLPLYTMDKSVIVSFPGKIHLTLINWTNPIRI